MTDTVQYYLCKSTTTPTPEYWKYRDSAAWLFRVWPDKVESSKNGDGWCNRGTRPEWFTSVHNTTCIRCDEHGNPLPAVPAESAKHHEPVQESVAPIYWRMKSERTSTQDMGAADWKAENGLVAVSAYSYDTNAVEWDESGLTVAELDADPDIERCNADGTPLAEHVPDAGTMVEPTPDAPLKVGDWVEILSIPPNVSGIKPGDTRQVDKIAKGSFRTLADNTAWWLSCCMEGINFRRVPPPIEQAERTPEQDRIAELTTERDELKSQLAQATRERDEYYDDLREARQKIVTLEERIPASERTKELASLREKLATAQAEAAAMREAFAKRVSFGCHFWNGANDTYIRFNDREKSLAAEHAIGSFLQGTAGRELLDELRRKDAEIQSLKGRQEYLIEASCRYKRKARTAKAELIEARAKLESRTLTDALIGTQDTSDAKGGDE